MAVSNTARGLAIPGTKAHRQAMTKGQLPVYTVATAPSVHAAGEMIYVSNGAAGSPIVAFSDGTNWKRCDTAATIS